MGHSSVREAQRCISSREFSEWIAFDRNSPIGGARSDWQAASIASTIANCMTSGNKHYEPEDFLLEFGEKTLPSTQDVGDRTMAIFQRIRKSMERKQRSGGG